MCPKSIVFTIKWINTTKNDILYHSFILHILYIDF